MNSELLLMAGAAALVGLTHTLLGPDHYLPFIALAKARRWSDFKTFTVTALCGLGHVGGSIALGLVGIALGIGLISLKVIESFRGEIASWLIIAFGFTYTVWAIHRLVRSRSHEHRHAHDGGEAHTHAHSHLGEHTHVHTEKTRNLTPWVLFIIFVFGPCEPLIPMIMYPATREDTTGVVAVAVAFSLATIITMLGAVFASLRGLSRLPSMGLARYSHLLAGAIILSAGGAIKLLGV